MTSKKMSAAKPRMRRAKGRASLPRLADPPIFQGYGGSAALDWGDALTDYLKSVLVPAVGAAALSPFTSVWLDAVSASSGALLDAAFTDIELHTGREALRIFKIRRRKMFLPLHLAWIRPMEFTPPSWQLGHGLDAAMKVKKAKEKIEEREQREGGTASMLVLRVWCAWCIADALRKWCEAKLRGRDLTAATWKRLYQLRVLTERMASRTKQIDAERRVLPDMARVAANKKNSQLERKDREGRIEKTARELRAKHGDETRNKFAETIYSHLYKDSKIHFGKDLIVTRLKAIGHTLEPPLIARKTKEKS